MTRRPQQVSIYPEIIEALRIQCRDIPHLNLTSIVNQVLSLSLNVTMRERHPRPYYPRTERVREPHLRLLEFLNAP